MASKKCPLCEGPSDESVGGLLTCEDSNCPMVLSWVDPQMWEAIHRKIQQEKRKRKSVWVAVLPVDSTLAFVQAGRTKKIALTAMVDAREGHAGDLTHLDVFKLRVFQQEG